MGHEPAQHGSRRRDAPGHAGLHSSVGHLHPGRRGAARGRRRGAGGGGAGPRRGPESGGPAGSLSPLLRRLPDDCDPPALVPARGARGAARPRARHPPLPGRPGIPGRPGAPAHSRSPDRRRDVPLRLGPPGAGAAREAGAGQDDVPLARRRRAPAAPGLDSGDQAVPRQSPRGRAGVDRAPAGGSGAGDRAAPVPMAPLPALLRLGLDRAAHRRARVRVPQLHAL